MRPSDHRRPRHGAGQFFRLLSALPRLKRADPETEKYADFNESLAWHLRRYILRADLFPHLQHLHDAAADRG